MEKKLIDILIDISSKKLKDGTEFTIINEDGEVMNCVYEETYPGYIWVVSESIPYTKFNYSIDHTRILNYKVIIKKENNIEEMETITKLPKIVNHHSIEWFMLEEIKKTQKKVNDIIKLLKK